MLKGQKIYQTWTRIRKKLVHTPFKPISYKKNGSPINATIKPAAIPSGSIKIRPMVFANNRSHPPSKIAIGRSNWFLGSTSSHLLVLFHPIC